MNGGHCHNKESGYECKCEHGYRGHDCAGIQPFCFSEGMLIKTTSLGAEKGDVSRMYQIYKL